MSGETIMTARRLAAGLGAFVLAACQTAVDPAGQDDAEVMLDAAETSMETPPPEAPALGPPPSIADAFSDEDFVKRGCEGQTNSHWSPISGVRHLVTAFTVGDDCLEAAAFLTIRDENGGLLWSDSFPAKHVYYLQYAQSADEMQSALEDWIDPDQNMYPAGDTLPEWVEGTLEPSPGSEFPFFPEEGYTREFYELTRTSDTVLFCYTQGLESSLCLEGGENGAFPVGVQVFPG
ncbi:MAG: hypothetical protein AAF719_11015 [Pseudomonadota bacterium]